MSGQRYPKVGGKTLSCSLYCAQMPLIMYSKSKNCTERLKLLSSSSLLSIIIFITTVTFQGIQESLKLQNSLALPGHKSNILKMGKN